MINTSRLNLPYTAQSPEKATLMSDRKDETARRNVQINSNFGLLEMKIWFMDQSKD